MKRGSSTRSKTGELRALCLGIVVTVALFALVTAAAGAFSAAVGIEFKDLSRDPASVLNGPNYTGYYANFTILLWQVPATSALLAAVLLRFAGRREASRLFLFGGLITAVMAVDDFFLLHETLKSTLGVPQKAEPLVYVAAIGAFTWFHRRRLRWNIVLVVLAVGCWGASAISDAIESTGVEVPLIVEDSAKLLGVSLWTLMMMRLVLAELRDVLRKRPAEPAEPTPRHRSVEETTAVALRAKADPDDLATTPVPVVPPQRPNGDGAPRRRPVGRAEPRMPSTQAVWADSATTRSGVVRPRHQHEASRNNGRQNGHRYREPGTS